MLPPYLTLRMLIVHRQQASLQLKSICAHSGLAAMLPCCLSLAKNCRVLTLLQAFTFGACTFARSRSSELQVAAQIPPQLGNGFSSPDIYWPSRMSLVTCLAYMCNSSPICLEFERFLEVFCGCLGAILMYTFNSRFVLKITRRMSRW